MKKLYLMISLFGAASITSGQEFMNQLGIPVTLNGPNFNISIQDGQTEFIPGIMTNTMGYNTSYLGPTLIFNKGETVSFNIQNTLKEATTIHWHGFQLPAKFDGGPHNVIDSSATWSPAFEVLESASTMWYHTHLHHNTARQVSSGLAGMIIVRDTIEASYNLPRTYGVDDIPLVLQDKKLDSTGQIVMDAVLGDTFLINGTLSPYIDVPAQMVRLRLLNGSIQRIYNLGFHDDRSFKIIASDGGLLESPVSVNRLILSPGERFEIIVDLLQDQNDSLYLFNYASEMPYGYLGGIPGADVYPSPLNGTDNPMLKFKVSSPTIPFVDSIPPFFAQITKPDSINSVKYRYKTLNGKVQGQEIKWNINNKSFDIARIDDTVQANSIEIWEIRNSTHFAHPFHIHSGHFFLLANDSMPPAEIDLGKKDVILVLPNTTVRFIMYFKDMPDKNSPFMYHCHMLDHEDDGMMAQFILVDSSFQSSIYNLESAGISFYPNPASNKLFVEQDRIIEPFIVNIYDIAGKQVHHRKFNSRRMVVNTGDFPSGFYIMSLRSGRKLYKYKFVKN